MMREGEPGGGGAKSRSTATRARAGARCALAVRGEVTSPSVTPQMKARRSLAPPPLQAGATAVKRGAGESDAAGRRRDQEASDDAARGAVGRDGSSRATTWHRSAAGTGFMSTGAARRMRKLAYSGV